MTCTLTNWFYSESGGLLKSSMKEMCHGVAVTHIPHCQCFPGGHFWKPDFPLIWVAEEDEVDVAIVDCGSSPHVLPFVLNIAPSDSTNYSSDSKMHICKLCKYKKDLLCCFMRTLNCFLYCFAQTHWNDLLMSVVLNTLTPESNPIILGGHFHHHFHPNDDDDYSIMIFAAARYDYPAKEYSDQEESKLLNYLMANYDRSPSTSFSSDDSSSCLSKGRWGQCTTPPARSSSKWG